MNGFDFFLGPGMTGLAVAVLVTLSIGGLIYGLFQPSLSGTKRRDERLTSIASRPQTADHRKMARDGDRRKKSIQDQLKEFEDRQKARVEKSKKISLNARLEQAGLLWEKKHFIYFSLVSGLIFFVLGFIISQNWLVIAAIAFVGTFGFPRWYIGMKRKRRFNAFLDEMPNAVDVIVRGVKAGLPLGDCIKIVAREAREPVASEFRKIVETQVMGVSLSEAVAKLPERVPLAEANFFAIVVAIQQKAGGGLAEALGNLAKVLRGRKTIKRKISALSAEAKASAWIVGSLPFIIAILIYFVAPDYISILFTTTTGNIVVGVSLFWMSLGILTMRKMVNFDF